MKQKAQKKGISIKAKLLGTILPVVIVIGLVLMGGILLCFEADDHGVCEGLIDIID